MEKKIIIKNIVEEICPLDFDLLGENVVESIIDGRDLHHLSGGRHLDLVESISLVSGLVTLIQVSYQVISNPKKDKNIKEIHWQVVEILKNVKNLKDIPEELKEKSVIDDVLNTIEKHSS